MAHPAGTHFKGPVVSANGFKILDSAAAITKILTGSVAVNPASLAANSSAETAVTISGVAAGDIVILNVPASLEAGLAFSGARASATDTVQLRLSNVTASPVDGASLSWTYLILRLA